MSAGFLYANWLCQTCQSTDSYPLQVRLVIGFWASMFSIIYFGFPPDAVGHVNLWPPIDLRALKALKRSPMALDLYTWLTYRMSYLERLTEIPWGALQLQFGADYPYTAQGTGDFKRMALAALKKILVVYPKLRASDGPRGLRLLPSPSHVLGA